MFAISFVAFVYTCFRLACFMLSSSYFFSCLLLFLFPFLFNYFRISSTSWFHYFLSHSPFLKFRVLMSCLFLTSVSLFLGIYFLSITSFSLSFFLFDLVSSPLSSHVAWNMPFPGVIYISLFAAIQITFPSTYILECLPNYLFCSLINRIVLYCITFYYTVCVCAYFVLEMECLVNENDLSSCSESETLKQAMLYKGSSSYWRSTSLKSMTSL
jgi:hypothetical protein